MGEKRPTGISEIEFLRVMLRADWFLKRRHGRANKSLKEVQNCG